MSKNGAGKQMHRACPPNIQKGYADVSSRAMALTPQTVPEGKYELRAEAKTNCGKRVFCIEGKFDVTTRIEACCPKLHSAGKFTTDKTNPTHSVINRLDFYLTIGVTTQRRHAVKH